VCLAPAELHFGPAWMQPSSCLDAGNELHLDPAEVQLASLGR
jgi:hypothetical protein